MKNKVAIVILAAIVIGLVIFQVHGQQAKFEPPGPTLVSISAYQHNNSSLYYVYRAWSDGTVEFNQLDNNCNNFDWCRWELIPE